MIIDYICTKLGLSNGTRGIVVGLIYADIKNTKQVHHLPPFAKLHRIECKDVNSAVKQISSLPILLIQIDEGSYKGISFDSTMNRVIAIPPKTYTT